ncbi:MAG TPA: hypothetical protein VGM20_03035 [Gemmatimonadales bacterium]|jgi:hypothetical protein
MAVAIVIGALHGAAAQSSADPAVLDRFRDSLRAIDNTAAIIAIEDRLSTEMRQRSRHDAAQLRLGFAQLRQGELEQRRIDFTIADATFAAVTSAHRDWAAGWLGRGLAQLNLIDNQPVTAGSVARILHRNQASDIAAKFERSSSVAGGDPEPLLTLATIAVANAHPIELQAALAALRHGAPYIDAANAVVALDRVRLERLAGSPDSARWFAVALLRRQPRDPATLLEMARSDFAIGDDAGAEDWFDGLAAADSAVVRLYRDDLVALLPDSIARRFDQDDATARVALLQRFLGFDDAGEQRSVAARLREHYHRLDHARLAFVRPTPHYVADIAVDTNPIGPAFDDRGVVWILHGPPDEHTWFNQVGVPPNETWHYAAAATGGDLLFNFVRTDDSTGFHRVSSVFDILALSTPLRATGHGDVKGMAARGEAVETYGASWTAQTAQEMLYSRENTSATYGKMLSQGKRGALALQRQERAQGDSSIASGESHAVDYELPLDATVNAIAVGVDAAGPLLQIAFAIPGTSLYAPPAAGPVVYPVHIRASVRRQGSNAVIATVDTLRRFVAAQPIADERFLVGRVPMHLPPGEYTVRVEVETPGRGMIAPVQPVRVAATGALRLDLSDLALGSRSVPLPWTTARGDTVWVNPLSSFHRSEPMQLYCEVGGVPAGSQYHAVLSIYHDRQSTPALRLAFAPTAAATPDPVQRDVDISGLKPGTYRLEIVVTAGGNARVARDRTFTVVK